MQILSHCDNTAVICSYDTCCKGSIYVGYDTDNYIEIAYIADIEIEPEYAVANGWESVCVGLIIASVDNVRFEIVEREGEVESLSNDEIIKMIEDYLYYQVDVS